MQHITQDLKYKTWSHLSKWVRFLAYFSPFMVLIEHKIDLPLKTIIRSHNQ